MTTFECPSCRKPAPRLIAGGAAVGCDGCLGVRERGCATRHQVVTSKWGVRVTHADAMRIKTNRKRPDGKYRPEPRWQSRRDDV